MHAVPENNTQMMSPNGQTALPANASGRAALVWSSSQPVQKPSQPIQRLLHVQDPGVTRRVLDYMLFMNSKVLFKQVSSQNPL